jgi:DNA uptake protein ComE-like DNA-binding protein
MKFEKPDPNLEYLRKLRELIDETEKTGEDYVEKMAEISLKTKYQVHNLNGVGEGKVRKICEYMSENRIYQSCNLLEHDLTSISGIGVSAEEKIKDRIEKTKDKIVEFK